MLRWRPLLLEKRKASEFAAAAKRWRGKRNYPEELPPDAYCDICIYYAANPAFDPQRVLLGRLFFLNANKTK